MALFTGGHSEWAVTKKCKIKIEQKIHLQDITLAENGDNRARDA